MSTDASTGTSAPGGLYAFVINDESSAPLSSRRLTDVEISHGLATRGNHNLESDKVMYLMQKPATLSSDNRGTPRRKSVAARWMEDKRQ